LPSGFFFGETIMSDREIPQQDQINIQYNPDSDRIIFTQRSFELGEDMEIYVTRLNAKLLVDFLTDILQEL
jgi:hypothetical protein